MSEKKSCLVINDSKIIREIAVENEQIGHLFRFVKNLATGAWQHGAYSTDLHKLRQFIGCPRLFLEESE